jgi:molybdenum cofactor cytidylyltransferase
MLGTAEQSEDPSSSKHPSAGEQAALCEEAGEHERAERRGQLGAVVLAAGLSTRFGGEPKQLASWQGEALVRRAAKTVLASSLRPVVLVLGHRAAAVAAEVADLTEITTVVNNDPRRGLASSVAVGLEALQESQDSITGAVFVPIDQPWLSAALLDLMAQIHERSPEVIVQPASDGRPGSPTLFPRRLFAALRSLRGDEGGRLLIRQGEPVFHFEVDEPRELEDLDTRQQFEDLARSTRSQE